MTDRRQSHGAGSWPWSEWWPWAIALLLVSAIAAFALSIASHGCSATSDEGRSLCRDFYLVPLDIRPVFMAVVLLLAVYFVYRIIRSVQHSKNRN